MYTSAQKDLGKFTSCRTFGAHKLVHSERFWKCNPFRKKRCKLRRNRPINGNAMRVRTMQTNKKTNKKNKHHIFAPTAGARRSIFPKLQGVLKNMA